MFVCLFVCRFPLQVKDVSFYFYFIPEMKVEFSQILSLVQRNNCMVFIFFVFVNMVNYIAWFWHCTMVSLFSLRMLGDYFHSSSFCCLCIPSVSLNTWQNPMRKIGKKMFWFWEKAFPSCHSPNSLHFKTFCYRLFQFINVFFNLYISINESRDNTVLNLCMFQWVSSKDELYKK